MTQSSRIYALTILLISVCLLPRPSAAAQAALTLNKGDHVCYIGNTMADRMQHHAWLETYIHAMHPDHDLTFRNLGFAGDEVKVRPRSASFGSPDQWLTKCSADLVFCFFGYNEALRGEAGLADFKKDLGEMLDGMLAQKYNGKSAPRIVVFSPIAHEDLKSPHLPDGIENNEKLAMYTAAMQQTCAAKGVKFIDLFHPTLDYYKRSQEPLTMNGIHLLDRGNHVVAQMILKPLLGTDAIAVDEAELERLRQVVLEKNYYWFSRYRVVDGYNVFGGRSTLNWNGQSNYDVMQREMAIFDIMTANRDKRVWAVAKGGDMKVVDENVPELLEVKANKQSEYQAGLGAYLDGEEAIGKMRIAEGMQVNLFASEEMFPEMVNPVQMAVDTDGRLFASVWPSYPHWNPTEPRTDRILCLPDEDGDGVADKCIIFADELNSITGFEFWGGGMLVAAPPEIWFLKDTDGDDQADFKLRMLQGVSSADTHHSANAVVIGPDGWLYWSRGIFNVSNKETPTKTFRSGKSGVYRFNPRTFEVEFHFPIGPNPHGDVFDQWGYQFANDGTGGTGSYVNIGKGQGNKQWFKKRVRPVAATGILSSEHFPEQNSGNFLICNTIGVLGVLQHEVNYNGADITAEEIEPILISSDPNFRPTDVEVGGDGALYVSDWCNALIGHMQHNMRDPNRDHSHGRIYRVTYKGRPLTKPVKMKGKPIETVLESFFSGQNSTRYRARLELSGRDPAEIKERVSKWASELSPNSPAEAQALLECLWVFEEHRIPNMELLQTVLKAKEPRVRAAAIRTLGHWGQRIEDWEPTLIAAARDDSALVRAEAVKAAVSFDGLSAAEIIFEVATKPTDAEIDTVLNYAKGRINVDAVVQDAVKSGQQLSVAAQQYVLRNASAEDLLKLQRSEAVYRAILDRDNVAANHLDDAIKGLAKITGENELMMLRHLILEKDGKGHQASIHALGELLIDKTHNRRDATELTSSFARDGKTAATRQIGYAAWMATENAVDNALAAASKDKGGLRDILEAIPKLAASDFHGDPQRSQQLYAKLQPLMSGLPSHLQAEQSGPGIQEQGIQVDYFEPNPSNVAIETLAQLEPKASGIVPEIKMDVPQLARRDAFALRFTGTLQADQPGRYRFFTNSDDGSRLYIGDELVVDNDGLHGMAQKSGRIRLSAGAHPIVVTYYDNGGGDGLSVSWSGPGFRRQPIPKSRLSVTGADTIHDVAIRSLATIPNIEQKAFVDLAKLLAAGKYRNTAVATMLSIPREKWPSDSGQQSILPAAESLAAYVADIPARYRTAKHALQAMELTDALASLLPDDQARRFQSQVADLRINIIRIGTVPERMIYDKETIAVQAGKSVEFVVTNSDQMPHNFAITLPGAMQEIGELAEATARDADAIQRHYIPKSDKIMLASRLLQPGDTQALSFEAPQQPGIYPYVCTYPGHWRRMYGALYVVADLKEYSANPIEYLASHPLKIHDELLKYTGRNTEWTYDDLALSLGELHQERSFEVGKTIFKAASCVACHRLNDEGYEFGPDLAKLDEEKRNFEHILRSMVEPSKVIDEKYLSYAIELDSGKVVTGLLLKETPETVEIIVDPIAKPEPIVIQKSSIAQRTKSPVSTMPKGLLNKLLREEILDLIAYVYTGGDQKHKLFQTGLHGH